MSAPIQRQRVLQVGFVVAALLAVWVADETAEQLRRSSTGLTAARLQTALVLVGRAVGGWSLGMAFRLQFTRASRPDAQLRRLVVLPAAVLCGWPFALTFLPAGLRRALPDVLVSGPVVDLAPFMAIVLGLGLALAVTRGRA